MSDKQTSKSNRRFVRKPDNTDQAPAAGEATSGESPATTKALTKIGQVLSHLKREDGATLDELVTLTGWLPHTTRAALTGLKKGHVIERVKRGDKTCYRVMAQA